MDDKAPPPLHLSDPQQAGVFFVTDEDLPTLETAAGKAMLSVHHFDLARCSSKPDLLQQLAEVLQFPEGSGHNWDALSDLLSDLSWLTSNGHVLLFAQAPHFRESAPDSFDTLLDILEEACNAQRDQNRPLWAFLTLPDAEFIADGQLAP